MMQDIQIKMQEGVQKAINCFNRLKNMNDPRFDLPLSVDFFCFRVKFKNSQYSISVSFPPDMLIGNYETALFKGDELYYKEEWGYVDIKRFMTFQDLVDELLYIHDKCVDVTN